jgi:hypothetical integral membrane protein (TIGR02206 family)
LRENPSCCALWIQVWRQENCPVIEELSDDLRVCDQPTGDLHRSRSYRYSRDKILSMHVYTTGHLLWLGAIGALSVVLSILCRRERISKIALRIGLVVLLVGGELQRYFHDGVALPDRLPLNLCNVTTWVAVLALLTLSPLASEFTYFSGLAGAGMALLTPDMGVPWHPRFFVNHGGLIVTAVVLVAGGIAPIRRGWPWRAYGLLLAYAAAIGIFNWRFGTNYSYLAHKPTSPTAMDFLGPWPVYIAGLAALGAGLFWLLWLPLRPRQVALKSHDRGPSLVTKYFHGSLAQQSIERQPSGPEGQQG